MPELQKPAQQYNRQQDALNELRAKFAPAGI